MYYQALRLAEALIILGVAAGAKDSLEEQRDQDLYSRMQALAWQSAATHPLPTNMVDGAGAAQGLDKQMRNALRQPHARTLARVRNSNGNSFRWQNSGTADHTVANRSAPRLLSGLRSRAQRSSGIAPIAEVISEVPTHPAQSEDALRDLIRNAFQWQGDVSDAAESAGLHDANLKTRHERVPRLARRKRAPMLVQRSSTRARQSLRGEGAHYLHGFPRNVEEGDYMYGLPKIVWVICADVLALAVFLSCIPVVILHAKQPKIEEVTVV